MTDVRGFCPMGCGQTLTLGEGGHLACRKIDCPNPSALSEILSDPETEHVVTFDRFGWSVVHPLRERLNGQLLTCVLQRYLSEWQSPPQVTGRYRATEDGPVKGRWIFERLGS